MNKISYRLVDELIDAKYRQVYSAIKEPLKYGQQYYTFISNVNSEWVIVAHTWENTPRDYAFLLSGLIFSTKEEAEDALPLFAKKFGVKYRIHKTVRRGLYDYRHK